MIKYTRREEIWNAASHGGGIVLGVVFGIIFLVWCFQSDNNWARVGVILYLFGMLGSYVASTLYHSMKHHSKWKERLRRRIVFATDAGSPARPRVLGMESVYLRVGLCDSWYHNQFCSLKRAF